MRYSRVVSVLIFAILCVTKGGAALRTCYSCDDVASPSDCNTMITCPQDQQYCFEETFLYDSGEQRVRVGCAASSMCSVGRVVVGKKRDHPNTCNSCCDSDLCNNNTCEHYGPTSDPCARHQCLHGTCYANLDRYVCVCNQGYAGGYCNIKVEANPCLSNPCVVGDCSDMGTSYKCHCRPGFMGTNCDQVEQVNQCSSSPCVHGRCTSHGTYYRCTCELGYTGKNCDTYSLSDPCLVKPCNHGTCHRNGTTNIYCSCDKGFTCDRCQCMMPPDCNEPGPGCFPIASDGSRPAMATLLVGVILVVGTLLSLC